jgi:CHAT domain-containing protein
VAGGGAGPWRAVGLGLTHAVAGFPALPNVRAELQSVVTATRVPGVEYLDEAFTRARLEQGLALGLPIMHIASHFRFAPGSDEASFLVLGDGSHLSLRALREEEFRFDRLDLLTLSACDTAMLGGRDQDGREVEGLAVLAQSKGAKSVLATLWPIADRSTAMLMREFYRLRETGQLEKAEALREAQLSLLRGRADGLGADGATGAHRGLERETPAGMARAAGNDGPGTFAHPYYWAPFVLMGSWK